MEIISKKYDTISNNLDTGLRTKFKMINQKLNEAVELKDKLI
jgi:hypothetical protein